MRIPLDMRIQSDTFAQLSSSVRQKSSRPGLTGFETNGHKFELLRAFALLKPAISETGLQWEVTYLRCALTWDLGIVCTSPAAGAW